MRFLRACLLCSSTPFEPRQTQRIIQLTASMVTVMMINASNSTP